MKRSHSSLFQQDDIQSILQQPYGDDGKQVCRRSRHHAVNTYISLPSANLACPEPSLFDDAITNKNKNNALLLSKNDGSASSCGLLVQQQHKKNNDNKNGSSSLHAHIAHALNKLSSDERSKAFEDLHGVATPVEESPQLIERCIKKMTNKISKVRSVNRTAFNKAAFLNPRHVKSTALWLMFLRATSFNPTKAANRIIAHFEQKLHIFGPDRLAKEITLADLDPEAKRAFFMPDGLPCMFPGLKDQVGRAYLAYQFQDPDTKKKEQGTIVPASSPGAKHRMQAAWYMIMSCLMDDPKTQQQGANMIICTLGADRPSHFAEMAETHRQLLTLLLPVLPVRITACHICVDSAAGLSHLTPTMSHLLPHDILVRTKIHSSCCNKDSLQSYGVNRFIMEQRSDFVQQWIQQREHEEDVRRKARLASMPPGVIEFPRDRDVLLGRGIPFQRHTGTTILKQLVRSRTRQHIEGDRFDKQILAEVIAAELKDSGVSFLERDPTGEHWVEVHDLKAHEKIAMSFRNFVREQTQTHQQQA